MVNKEFVKDISKFVEKSDLGGSQELEPGVTGRRYEPECGVDKHNARIHRESSQIDKYGKLPFKFSKPDLGKCRARGSAVICDNCGRVTTATVNTIGIVCSGCGEYSSVTQVV